MSHSKIIELRKFGKQASTNDFDNNHDLASQQECIRLLRAFTQIGLRRLNDGSADSRIGGRFQRQITATRQS